MREKIYTHEMSVGELREMFMQSVFGKSDTEITAMFAEHGIEVVGLHTLLDSIQFTPSLYLKNALEHLGYAILSNDYPIEILRNEMASHRIPDDLKVWEWDK